MPEPRITTEKKQAVVKRARGCCEYCHSQARFSPDPFSIEHIIPRSASGTSDLSNLALSCQGCNNRKYTSMNAVDPLSGETCQLYHPREHHWNDHFSWSHDFTQIIGMTPIGRATIEKLQLNREALVNLRRILHSANEHPSLVGV